MRSLRAQPPDFVAFNIRALGFQDPRADRLGATGADRALSSSTSAQGDLEIHYDRFTLRF